MEWLKLTQKQLKATENTFKENIDYKQGVKLSRIEPKFKNTKEHNYKQKRSSRQNDK